MWAGLCATLSPYELLRTRAVLPCACAAPAQQPEAKPQGPQPCDTGRHCWVKVLGGCRCRSGPESRGSGKLGWAGGALLCAWCQNVLLSLSPTVDHSRVELSLITSDTDSHYINANFIKVPPCPRSLWGRDGSGEGTNPAGLSVMGPSRGTSGQQDGGVSISSWGTPTQASSAGGGGRGETRAMFTCAPDFFSGSVWTESLHSHAGASPQHRGRLLEDDLGI